MTTDQRRGGGVDPASHRTGPPDDEISLWEVLAVLLRRSRLILGSVVVVAALAVALAFLRDRTWTTAASFRPQGSSGASELASLASQFGVNVGGADEGESPAFYQEVLGSREMLSRVAAGSFRVEGRTVPLVDLLEIREDVEALRLDRAIRWLREEAVGVTTGQETGTVTLEVQTRWPEVSLAIAEELLNEVSRFNLETRQSQARAEREFIESRVRAAEEALRSAESALQEFARSNRVVGEFSELSLERDRLTREVLNRQQVYNTLVQSYEQARISEVRDTPVITVLQAPYLPPKPDGRGVFLSLALGLVLGAMLGMALAFVLEIFQRPGDGGDPARQDFQEAWAGLKESLPFVRDS